MNAREAPGAAPAVDVPLLRVRGLSKRFIQRLPGVLRRSTMEVRAVDDVSFDLVPGETLGIVGESGSGKTTMVRCLLRAIRPSAGTVEFTIGGRTFDLAALSEREIRPLRPHMQMIFQDPYSSLNPRMSVGDIVAEPLVIHRMARGRELADRVEQMLVRVGLEPEHLKRHPNAFSGGQRQRIGIARALIMSPSLVVADEPVSALDVSVQAQVINLLRDLQEERRLTYIFVSHDLSVVRHICDRVAVMYAGRMVEIAPLDRLFADPRHPYTRLLLSAAPSPDPDVKMNFESHGEVADPGSLPSGCAFHPRCRECFAPCARHVPRLLDLVGDGGARVPRSVACHLHHPSPAVTRR